MVDELNEHEADVREADVREYFAELGLRRASRYAGSFRRSVTFVWERWLDLTAIGLVGIALFLLLSGSHVGGRHLATMRALTPFSVVRSADLFPVRPLIRFGGYLTEDEVRDRVVMVYIDSGSVLRPAQLSDYRLSPQQRRLLATGTVVKVPVTGVFEHSLVSGRQVTLLATPDQPMAPPTVNQDEGEQIGFVACMSFDNVLVLSVGAGDAGQHAIVVLPSEAVPQLSAIMAGWSFRPIVGPNAPEGCSRD